MQTTTKIDFSFTSFIRVHCTLRCYTQQYTSDTRQLAEAHSTIDWALFWWYIYITKHFRYFYKVLFLLRLLLVGFFLSSFRVVFGLFFCFVVRYFFHFGFYLVFGYRIMYHFYTKLHVCVDIFQIRILDCMCIYAGLCSIDKCRTMFIVEFYVLPLLLLLLIVAKMSCGSRTFHFYRNDIFIARDISLSKYNNMLCDAFSILCIHIYLSTSLAYFTYAILFIFPLSYSNAFIIIAIFVYLLFAIVIYLFVIMYAY